MLTLPNSVIGIQRNNSFADNLINWLAIVGDVISWVLILLLAIYVGNGYMYKMDNLIIFAQSMYYFLFVNNLVGKGSLAQFYQGWKWLHGGFYVNYFSNTIPAGYFESTAPVPYMLSVLDGNLVRNAGFSFSLAVTFFGGWLILSLFMYVLFKVCKKIDVWHPSICKDSLLAFIEFISFNIFYFCLTE